MKKLVFLITLALLASCKKQNQSTSFLEMKVKKEQLPLVTDRNTTPLMLLEKAIKDGDLKAAGMLLKSRTVDPNTVASTGEPLTVFAFKQNQYKVAQLLLIEGNNGDYYDKKGDLITIPGLILDKYIGETEKNSKEDVDRDLELFGFFTRLGSNINEPVFSNKLYTSEIILKYAIEADIHNAKNGIESKFTAALAENGLRVENYESLTTPFAYKLRESSNVVSEVIESFAKMQNYKVFGETQRQRINLSQEKALTEPQLLTFIPMLGSLFKAGLDVNGSHTSQSILSQMMYELDPEVFQATYFTLRNLLPFSIYNNRNDEELSSTVMNEFIIKQDRVCETNFITEARTNDDCFIDFTSNLAAYIKLLEQDMADDILDSKIKELLNNGSINLDLFANNSKVSPQVFVLLIALGADLRDWRYSKTDFSKRDKRRILKALAKVDKDLKNLIHDQKRKKEKRHFQRSIELLNVIIDGAKPDQKPTYLIMDDIL